MSNTGITITACPMCGHGTHNTMPGTIPDVPTIRRVCCSCGHVWEQRRDAPAPDPCVATAEEVAAFVAELPEFQRWYDLVKRDDPTCGDDRLTYVLRLRCGIDGSRHTLAEAAKKLGCTKERVRLLEAKAWRQMKMEWGLACLPAALRVIRAQQAAMAGARKALSHLILAEFGSLTHLQIRESGMWREASKMIADLDAMLPTTGPEQEK